MERELFKIIPHLDLEVFKSNGRNFFINYFSADFERDVLAIFGSYQLTKPGSKKFIESVKEVLGDYKQFFCYLNKCHGLPSDFKDNLTRLVDEHNARFK